jgi:AAA domain
LNFRLNSLDLSLKRGEVSIPFEDVNYFWGEMGAGKTSIARLIDYCLGGDIELSPALQGEFVSAKLSLTLAKGDLTIERPRDSDRVICIWGEDESAMQASIPARSAEGEVVPSTGVEVLSDLVFLLSGIVPPRVRKSKSRQDSDTARLSLRDLLWFCYLDQDSMDSSFYHLDENAAWYLRNKSRDVIRYVIGFHDERVAELEAQLDQLRGERQALSSTMVSTVRVLKEVGVESERALNERVAALRKRADELQKEIETARDKTRSKFTSHALDDLRPEAQRLDEEVRRIEAAISDLVASLDRDTRHLNEIETLTLKFKRSASARAVLSGVAFTACPRCAQGLPHRESGCCAVCGQADIIVAPDPSEEVVIDRDVKARAAELREHVARHQASLDSLTHTRKQVLMRKAMVEIERNEASKRFDSALLSAILVKERERASLLQEASSLAGLSRLTQMVETQKESIAKIETRERMLRDELKMARETAENDATNLEKLKELYLDCLTRAGVPDIFENDIVDLPASSFFPSIRPNTEGEAQITSFATISSGGKKNLFKSCFAIAIHRLAEAERAPLPSLLIIDSAMKNISERENRRQFEGFYLMLYELKETELASTQIILIDKEYSAPPVELGIEVNERHMKLEDPEHPPLIPYM